MQTNTTAPTETPTPQSEYLDIVAYLAECETALTNATLPDIAPLLAARGYAAEEITDKLQELGALRTLNENQKKEYGEQYEATATYTTTETTLHATYMQDLGIARIVFKNDVAAQVALGLNGERKKSKSGYQAQALLLYNGALKNAAYKTALAKRGITQAGLTAQKTGFEGLSDLNAAQQKETGEAQAATKIRDAALNEFEEWMSDFKGIAIIALSGTPQLREKLGWKEE